MGNKSLQDMTTPQQRERIVDLYVSKKQSARSIGKAENLSPRSITRCRVTQFMSILLT